MSSKSIASPSNGSQVSPRQEAADLIEAHFVQGIATALHRYRTRNDGADFHRDLTPKERRTYLQEAAVVARRQDVIYTEPALYFAADCITANGIGSLTRGRRDTVVNCLKVGLRAYDQALAGDAPKGTLDVMTKLAEADAQSPAAVEAPMPRKVM